MSNLYNDNQQTTHHHYSLKEKAFLLFDIDFRPSLVATILKMKKATAYRYFEDYKKISLTRFDYRVSRKLYCRLNEDARYLLTDFLAVELNTSRQEVLIHMRRPWALKSIVTGTWRQ